MKQDKLFDRILKEFSKDCSLENVGSVEVDGIKYDYNEVKNLTTKDEGKYQCGGTIYSIGILDEQNGYGIIGEPLFYVEQNFTQTGSYYGEQEREYEPPYIVEKKEKTITVWEAI